MQQVQLHYRLTAFHFYLKTSVETPWHELRCHNPSESQLLKESVHSSVSTMRQHSPSGPTLQTDMAACQLPFENFSFTGKNTSNLQIFIIIVIIIIVVLIIVPYHPWWQICHHDDFHVSVFFPVEDHNSYKPKEYCSFWNRGYPAKRALSAIRKHSKKGPFGRIPSKYCMLVFTFHVSASIYLVYHTSVYQRQPAATVLPTHIIQQGVQ